ncbi:MAG: GNAT family N-acetyltransferase [Aquisalinus sp.]|nr:GNAT family N-acetyltransferase [Aquisalinus sp.]
MTDYTIRPFMPEDTEALAEVFRCSIEELGPRDYSAAQVAVWASRVPDASVLQARLTDGRKVFVAESGKPVGFIDLEPDGHIDLLYVTPDVAGTGVAVALYKTLEQAARQTGLTRLYTEASEGARRFFLKQGFTELHRRDFDLSGIKIHNYTMEKRL